MPRSRTSWQSPAAMALLAATCLTPLGWAQAAPGDPRGGEFQVNSYTTQRQAEPAVAMDRDGDFVVVWQSNSQDNSFYGIYAQRYNAQGVAGGSEFRVNVTTGGSQNFPTVAMDEDGNFVVAWESYQDGSGYGIYARRYDAAGTTLGGEFRVNATTGGDQRYPAVAMDADGDFVVAWQGPDTSGDGIYARRYNAAGVAQGGEVLVNTHTTSDQDRPALAMDASGDFVVVWQSYGQDGDSYGVYAQRYNAAGAVQGGEFPINTATGGLQRHPTADMDDDGDFVVAWEDFTHDGDGWGIYAQRFDAAGVAQDGNFVANSLTFGWQNRPSVAMDAGGGFAVSWHSTFHEGDGLGVYVRRFDAAGAAQGADAQVNTYTTLDQDYPAVASSAYGDMIVAWRSNGQDTDRTGIYAQRYAGSGPAATDFDAEMHSDILWRNTATGNTAIWLMNGFDVVSGDSVGAVDMSWQIQDVGDIDGDRRADILWRNTGSGNTVVWAMDGVAMKSAASIGVVDGVWQIRGLGDTGGDGMADILWRNTADGTAFIWQMDGFGMEAGQSIGTVDTAWQVKGLGDFDGDGKADILWRHANGSLAIWLMDGFNVIDARSLGSPSDWQIAGLGDFDGGGKADILWRNASGSVAIWLMDGFVVEAAAIVGNPGNDWQIVNVGDFSKRAKSDILWRNITNGNTVIWQMNGFTMEDARSIGAPSTDWQVR